MKMANDSVPTASLSRWLVF